MGLLYRYVKVILNNLKPKTQEPGEIVRMIRSINQQSHAFTREIQENIMSSKKELSSSIPSLKSDFLDQRMKEIHEKVRLVNREFGSINEDSLKNGRMSVDDYKQRFGYGRQGGVIKEVKEVKEVKEMKGSELNGIVLFEQSMIERRMIVEKKRKAEIEKSKLY